jgi:photosystem II stability/assembly factor-like uncharacterized protein
MNADTSRLDQLKALRWRHIGPFRGGRAPAVIGHPTEQATFYMGTSGGGLWKTEDAGTFWEPISDGFFNRSSIASIALCEADHNVLYVGTGEPNIRSDVSHGDGVYKSTDGGQSWSNVGLGKTRNIGKVRVHPQDLDLVYVAALGHAHGSNPERGVFRSKDGGETWEHVLFQSETAGAVDLSLDPTNPRIIYAAFWEGVHKAHELVSGGPGSGVFRSLDGGDTWEDVSRNSGMPEELMGRIGVSASGARPGRVWAIIEAHDGGLFRSEDYGKTWENVHSDGNIRQRPWYYMHVFADPTDPDTVWVLNLDCWKSTDGGRNFEKVESYHPDYQDLWIDPKNSSRMILGTDGGASVTFNGGASWSTIFNQPTNEFYHVTTDNQVPYRIYGAQQDNTTISLPSRTHLPGIEWGDAYEVGGGESGYIAVRPDDPLIVYAGSFAGMLTRFDRRTNQRKNIMVWPEEIAGWAERDIPYRFQWTFPIVLSPHDPDVLYVTSQFVHRSTDEGQTWETISPDLTRNDPEKMGPSGGPITTDSNSMDYYCTIFAFAESSVQQGILWTGSDDGLIHVSQDNGENWENVTPPDLPTWSLISIIEASPHDAGTAYVAVDRHRHDDFAPYFYKTSDFGQSWTKIVSGIPGDDFARVIREDPAKQGVLYAGTETGVYVSSDDGANWFSLRLNMPAVPVHDLVLKNEDIVLGTHGRGFWVMDDRTPLHHLSNELSENEVRLFPPRETTRFWTADLPTGEADPNRKSYNMYGMTFRRLEGPDGQPVTKWLDVGENPPDGAIVHYWLPDGVEKATLTFHDAEGNEVRQLSSQKPENGDSEGQNKDPLIPARPGMNRYVWNMRYADAFSFEGAIYRRAEGLNGPLVPPGTYTVTLQAGDVSQSQSFTIVPDPRNSATPEEIAEQSELLLKLRDSISEANRNVLSIRTMREDIAYWTNRVSGDTDQNEISSAAEALESRLSEVENELVQTKWKSSRDALTAPSKLTAKLTSLATNIAGGGEGKPTRQSYEVFESLKSQLETQLQELRSVKRDELARFNEAIANAQLPAISASQSSDSNS